MVPDPRIIADPDSHHGHHRHFSLLTYGYRTDDHPLKFAGKKLAAVTLIPDLKCLEDVRFDVGGGEDDAGVLYDHLQVRVHEVHHN